MSRVLIVDDSPTDLQNMKAMLVKAGHQVLLAANVQEANQALAADRPDCIVMDVVMPGVSGFQATRQLSRDPQTQDIPIIVVSAKAQETDRLWALRQGAREYVVKPVREAELLAKLHAVLVA